MKIYSVTAPDQEVLGAYLTYERARRAAASSSLMSLQVHETDFRTWWKMFWASPMIFIAFIVVLLLIVAVKILI